MTRRLSRGWAIGAAVLLAAACGGSSQIVQLAGGVDLLPWSPVVFPAPEPLRTPAGPGVGAVCVMLRAPFMRDRDSVGIRSPSGVLIRPAAAAIRSDGAVDTLAVARLRGLDEICLGPDSATVLRPPYAAVRVTASGAVSLDRVTWQSVRRAED